jgi:hypothetical protein
VRHLANRVGAVRRLADHLESGLRVQKVAQPLADHFVIVGEDDRYRARGDPGTARFAARWLPAGS